jgi:two-component system, sensor histidine kinase LadS
MKMKNFFLSTLLLPIARRYCLAWLGVVVIVLHTNSDAHAETISLTNQALSGSALGTQVDILEDKSAQMNIQDVTGSGSNAAWKPSLRQTPSFGFTESAYWVRLRVANPQQYPIDWLLEFGYPTIDSITVFIPEAGAYYIKIVGDHFPFHQRDIDYRNCVVALKEPPASERTYYVRLRTTSAMNFPLYAWSPAAFTQSLSREQMIMGLYYGAMLVMLLYNLFLFFGIRDINYLYYICFIAGQIMYQFMLNGLAFQYLWQDAIWWANNSLPCFMGFATFWAVFFARSFLNSKTNAPMYDLLYRVALPLLALSSVSSLVIPYSLAIKITTFFAMVVAPFLIFNAILEWKNGYEPARYFAISWISFIAGVVLYTLKTFGVISSNTLTNLTLQIGSLLQVILLSLALVGKFNVMRRDFYKSQQDLVKAQMKTFEVERARQDAEIYRLRNVELAQAYNDVEQKNEEMERLNDSLREMNNEKNEFLGIVAHDLKNPLSNISMLGKVLSEEANTLSKQEVAEFAGDIRAASGRMFELITNLLDVNAIENKAVRLTPIPFDLTEIAQLVTTDYRGRAEAKQLRMHLEIPPDNTMVFADKSSTLQIIDNIVSNAIKYSPHSKNIYIRLCKRDNIVCFEVQDEGQGLSADDKQKLFGKFARLSAQPTGGEHSTGLGLSIAKKLAQAMNGDIGCQSTVGEGATFTVSLPAVNAAFEVE